MPGCLLMEGNIAQPAAGEVVACPFDRVAGRIAAVELGARERFGQGEHGDAAAAAHVRPGGGFQPLGDVGLRRPLTWADTATSPVCPGARSGRDEENAASNPVSLDLIKGALALGPTTPTDQASDHEMGVQMGAHSAPHSSTVLRPAHASAA